METEALKYGMIYHRIVEKALSSRVRHRKVSLITHFVDSDTNPKTLQVCLHFIPPKLPIKLTIKESDLNQMSM
jgi:hypothetical protein